MRAADRILGLLYVVVCAILSKANMRCKTCRHLVTFAPKYQAFEGYTCGRDTMKVNPEYTLCKHFERR